MAIANPIALPIIYPISPSSANMPLPNSLNKGAVSPQNSANNTSIKIHAHITIVTIKNIVYPFYEIIYSRFQI